MTSSSFRSQRVLSRIYSIEIRIVDIWNLQGKCYHKYIKRTRTEINDVLCQGFGQYLVLEIKASFETVATWPGPVLASNHMIASGPHFDLWDISFGPWNILKDVGKRWQIILHTYL